jgi:hypothetical protein
LYVSAFASSRDSGLENSDGIATPKTLSAPTASAAITAVREESIPPDRPITALRNPFLRR